MGRYNEKSGTQKRVLTQLCCHPDLRLLTSTTVTHKVMLFISYLSRLRHTAFLILAIFNRIYISDDRKNPYPNLPCDCPRWMQRLVWGVVLLLGHRWEDKGWRPVCLRVLLGKPNHCALSLWKLGKMDFSSSLRKYICHLEKGDWLSYWHWLLLREVLISALCFRRCHHWWPSLAI